MNRKELIKKNLDLNWKTTGKEDNFSQAVVELYDLIEIAFVDEDDELYDPEENKNIRSTKELYEAEKNLADVIEEVLSHGNREEDIAYVLYDWLTSETASEYLIGSNMISYASELTEKVLEEFEDEELEEILKNRKKWKERPKYRTIL